METEQRVISQYNWYLVLVHSGLLGYPVFSRGVCWSLGSCLTCRSLKVAKVSPCLSSVGQMCPAVESLDSQCCPFLSMPYVGWTLCPSPPTCKCPCWYFNPQFGLRNWLDSEDEISILQEDGWVEMWSIWNQMLLSVKQEGNLFETAWMAIPHT